MKHADQQVSTRSARRRETIFFEGIALVEPTNSLPGGILMSRIVLVALTLMTVSNALAVAPPSEFSNSIGMSFKLIPSGEFLMGAPTSDGDAWEDERPQHKVHVTRPFYLAETEVTQAQYEEIMGVNPSRFKGAYHPVEGVSWREAVEFCRRLSAKEERQYRLPTEAEWEYACRAGVGSSDLSGDSETSLEDSAWFANNSLESTHPVRTKQPNAWGLFDMHGNVWEWCNDSWHPFYYSDSPVNDPLGPEAEWDRVCRGGAWNSPASRCRSSARRWFPPALSAQSHGIIGFRVAVELRIGQRKTEQPGKQSPCSSPSRPLKTSTSPKD